MTKSSVRDAFRAQVFKRDNNRCVVPHCYRYAVDAHHLLERKLWAVEEAEGYLMDNCASVCEEHHKDDERNFIPPQALRMWAGIIQIVLPKSLDPSKLYNKWGDIIKPAPRFSIKYPHTPYLEFSPSADERDVDESGYIKTDMLVGKPLYVTVKMDGSNMFMDTEKVAARNGQDAVHKSFDMAKALHANIRKDIPENVQVFCEWLYAKHSIHYSGDMAVPDFCLVIGAYNRVNQLWYGFSDTYDLAQSLDLQMVPVIRLDFRAKTAGGITARVTEYGENAVKQGHEGVVIRSMYPCMYSQFQENIGKYVRRNHVQTDTHWMHQTMVRNEVKKR
jgi:hypothetical protein